MKRKHYSLALTLLICFYLLSGSTEAQSHIPEVRVSPQASVSQMIGFAEITLNYSRPGVKEREIWGKLVPYGLTEDRFAPGIKMPWRGGADENTTITLSHEAKIEGKIVPPGTYGLHFIVEPVEWTLILNKDNKAWGSYFYNDQNDILRVKLKPLESEFTEWLTYGFEDLSAESCTVYLRWEKLKIPFKIEFNKNDIVLERYREILMGDPGFFSNSWRDAARYLLENDTHLDIAGEWVERAYKTIRPEKFSIDVIKAELLEKAGKQDEAEMLIKEGIKTAEENELTMYCGRLIRQKKFTNARFVINEGLGIFKESWVLHYYSGRVYEDTGNKDKAKEAYEKSLQYSPEERKSFIQNRINGLQ